MQNGPGIEIQFTHLVKTQSSFHSIYILHNKQNKTEITCDVSVGAAEEGWRQYHQFEEHKQKMHHLRLEPADNDYETSHNQ